jgi:hypothetical protein
MTGRREEETKGEYGKREKIREPTSQAGGGGGGEGGGGGARGRNACIVLQRTGPPGAQDMTPRYV